MKKSFLLSLFCLSAVLAKAQDENPFGGGIQLSPVISWMHSNDKNVEKAGLNVGMSVGVFGHRYLDSKRRFALTLGLNYVLNSGGKLKYNLAGDHLPKPDKLSPELQMALDTINGVVNSLPAGASVLRKVNFVQIPLGFKMRKGLGKGDDEDGHFLYIFAHPTATFGITASSRGTVDFGNGTKYEKEILYGNTFPLQFSVGGGAGVEIYPDADNNFGFTAGVYYNGGIFDMTSNGKNGTRGRISDVTIRLGIMF